MKMMHFKKKIDLQIPVENRAYTFDEKVKYFKNRVKDNSLTENQRAYADAWLSGAAPEKKGFFKNIFGWLFKKKDKKPKYIKAKVVKQIPISPNNDDDVIDAEEEFNSFMRTLNNLDEVDDNALCMDEDFDDFEDDEFDCDEYFDDEDLDFDYDDIE